MYAIFPYLLVLMAVTRGCAEDPPVNLPTPRIYGISTSGGGPTILWDLDDQIGEEYVLGYKLKLWQVGCDKKLKYTFVDGKRVRLKNVMPKLHDFTTLRNFTEFTVDGVDNKSLLLKDIEPHIPYHVMVAAFSDMAVSPLSRPFRFQERGRYTCREI